MSWMGCNYQIQIQSGGGFRQPCRLFSPLWNYQSLANISNRPSKATKPLSLQPDSNIKIDAWTVLEDGAGLCPSSINTAAIAGCDHTNMKALSWLKGTVRVRRMDLTYIAAIDDDS
nr:mediator of RNA polymerase II transcription subunit 12 isoform X1 [Tanacetum cinerariifolium]